MSIKKISNNKTREEFLKKVINRAEYLLKNNDVNRATYSIINYVILHYYIKAVKLAKGILMLCEETLDSDAQILFRSLFEIGCYCEYINIDPKNIMRAENCIAISYIEDKKTEDYIKKFSVVDIDKMSITPEDKISLRHRVNEIQEVKNMNYQFIIKRLKSRDFRYKGLSDGSVIDKEKLTLNKVLQELNEVFNKETKHQNAFWKYYIFGFRTCAKSVHSTDFDKNVKRQNGKLEYILEGKENTVQVILGASLTFLLRIMDIGSSILQFKKDNTIKELFNQLKILQ